MSFLKRVFGLGSKSTNAALVPGDPVMSEADAMTNAAANALVYLHNGWVEVFDSTGMRIPDFGDLSERDIKISAMWVHGFPGSTTKAAFLLILCASYKDSKPTGADAAQTCRP